MPPDRIGARARAEARADMAGTGRPPTYDELKKRVQELEGQASLYRQRIGRLEAAVAIMNREKEARLAGIRS